jgi:ABC-type nitrate/sulfonate/bicarbonate transport system permease component
MATAQALQPDRAAPSRPARAPHRRRRRELVLRYAPIELVSLLGGALTWELAGRSLGLLWLPPLSQILADLVVLVQSEAVQANIWSSLQALLIGFGISLVVGLPVGALMGRFRSVEAALDVYVNALLVAPTIVLIPVFFAIFGLGDGTRLAVVVVYAIFVIIINTMTAIKTVDPAMVEMARSFGGGEAFIIRKVMLPASMPLVMAGIRLGLGRAVKGMITGEMLVTFVGLGALAAKFGSQFDMSKVFAVSIIVLVFAAVTNWLAQVADDRLTRWAD